MLLKQIKKKKKKHTHKRFDSTLFDQRKQDRIWILNKSISLFDSWAKDLRRTSNPYKEQAPQDKQAWLVELVT